MNKFVDLTGEVFGERIVTGFSHQNPTSRNLYWKYICQSCCHSGITSGTRLRKGSGCPSCAGKKNGRKGLYAKSKGLPVYFIQCEDWVKVGSSADIGRRLKDIQCSNPFEVKLLKVDSSKTEKEWHNTLKKAHYKGEWYWMRGVCEIVDLT